MTLTKATYSMIDGAPVNVVDYGSGSELGSLLQEAIDSGATYIEIPDATDWTWTVPVVLPTLWRGRIISRQSKKGTNTIVARTGHNNPCIDAQGALFVELNGFNVTANDATNAAPACFVVFARVLSGASSSNHRVVNNLIEGAFYYCGIYNCGGEEMFFENNYVSTYASANTITYQTACVVHTLNEDAYFSGIVTKEARTNAVSTSAITHIGDIIKNFNVGGSALYVGSNTNDITFELTYGTTPANSYFLSLGGYFDGIRLGVDRVETEKSSPIIYAPNATDAGLVSIYKGAYRRSGVVDAAKSAILIAGTTSNVVNIEVDGSVSWMSTFASGVEDIYLVDCGRKTTCDISFLNAGAVGTFANSIVDIAQLQSSTIVMGKAANLTVGSELGGNKYWFTYDFLTSAPAHKFIGGTNFSGATTNFSAIFGAYAAQTSTADSTSNSVHSYFVNPNGIVGSITTVGSATTYATSSDYRLKSDVKPISNALDRVNALKPCAYKWKIDGSVGESFLAHELQTVCPSAVVGKKDEVNAKGEPVYQAVDMSFVIPVLTKAIQELSAEVQALKNGA